MQNDIENLELIPGKIKMDNWDIYFYLIFKVHNYLY